VVSGDWTGLTFPVYSLVGGKWTSYRAFSEQAGDKALTYLGLRRQKSTRDLPIGGGRSFARNMDERKKQMEALAAWTGLDREGLELLYERYGSRAEAVADYLKRGSDEILKTVPGYTRLEIAFLALNEKKLHLDDRVLRCAMLAMLGQLTKAGLVELAEVTGEALGWTGEQKTAEAKRALPILAGRHGVRL